MTVKIAEIKNWQNRYIADEIDKKSNNNGILDTNEIELFSQETKKRYAKSNFIEDHKLATSMAAGVVGGTTMTGYMANAVRMPGESFGKGLLRTLKAPASSVAKLGIAAGFVLTALSSYGVIKFFENNINNRNNECKELINNIQVEDKDLVA